MLQLPEVRREDHNLDGVRPAAEFCPGNARTFHREPDRVAVEWDGATASAGGASRPRLRADAVLRWRVGGGAR